MSDPTHPANAAPDISFSVVIPLFNKAPHIRRAIDSVIAQTYPAHEVIVVDDASTDSGVELIASYNAYGIRLLRRDKPGPGGYAARNLGIHAAQSDWIAFLDADDEWDPTHLANLRSSILSADEPNDVVGVFAGYVNVHEDGRRDVDSFTARETERISATLSFEELLKFWIKHRACPVWTSASAFRRRTLIEAGLFPEGRARIGGDKDTWLRVSSLGPLRVATGVTAIYHRDAVNMVTRTSDTNVRHCMCDTVEVLAKQAPEQTKKLLHRMLNIEMFNYGIHATKRGTASVETYRSFKKSLDPWRFVLLMAASTRPGAATIRAIRHARNRYLRKLIGPTTVRGA
jgi:succinoglycan biosynthesis protein ExoO